MTDPRDETTWSEAYAEGEIPAPGCDLSPDALAVWRAYHQVRARRGHPAPYDVYREAGLTYEAGRKATGELTAAGLLRVTGDLG